LARRPAALHRPTYLKVVQERRTALRCEQFTINIEQLVVLSVQRCSNPAEFTDAVILCRDRQSCRLRQNVSTRHGTGLLIYFFILFKICRQCCSVTRPSRMAASQHLLASPPASRATGLHALPRDLSLTTGPLTAKFSQGVSVPFGTRRRKST